MKTIDQIKDDILNELSIDHDDNYTSWDNLLEWIAEGARTKNNCNVWNCEGESIDKSSILNTEIILP